MKEGNIPSKETPEGKKLRIATLLQLGWGKQNIEEKVAQISDLQIQTRQEDTSERVKQTLDQRSPRNKGKLVKKQQNIQDISGWLNNKKNNGGSTLSTQDKD